MINTLTTLCVLGTILISLGGVGVLATPGYRYSVVTGKILNFCLALFTIGCILTSAGVLFLIYVGG